MNELTINLHIHTTYSDGSGSHADLARAAINTGVDVLLVTDHNVLVQGINRYYYDGNKQVLVLACEEVHDQDRTPQKNHMLVFGSNRELASLADNPQSLIDEANRSGGLCFIAHPVDPALPAFGEMDISWVNWDITGFTGIELWNGFSELKSVAKGKWSAVAYAYFPEFISLGPLPETLGLWDELISKDKRVVAIGGSDAHALHKSIGPLQKTIFPYEYHFSSINTHTLVAEPLTGDVFRDSRIIFEALSAGHCFIGYDRPASTRGFHFSAQSEGSVAIMGDEITRIGNVILQVKLPSSAEIRMIKNGKVIKTIQGETLVHYTDEPGAYRIEVYTRFLGKVRGWIFSNPIYVR
jgi:hypothetical protein